MKGDRGVSSSKLNSANVITTKLYRGHNLVCDNSDYYYMSDAYGNIIETYKGNDKYPNDWYSYNAFGENEYFEDTCIPNKWGYCGQLRDWETGNYYMRARYYNPGTGRFISEDPIRDGSNWYSYCGGNPVQYYDNNGLYRILKTNSPNKYEAYIAEPTGALGLFVESLAGTSVLGTELYCEFMQTCRNMVATNSIERITAKDIVIDGSDTVINSLKKRLGENFAKNAKKAVKIFGAVSTLKDCVERINISETDYVVFKMFEMAKIGPNSSDLGYLTGVMQKSYEFISNNVSYYFGPEILPGKNLFGIDYDIYTSENPEKTIESYIYKYNISYATLSDYQKLEFETYIRDNYRRNNMVNSFKEEVLR